MKYLVKVTRKSRISSFFDDHYFYRAIVDEEEVDQKIERLNKEYSGKRYEVAKIKISPK
jgi:hypothetical protein